MGTGEAVDLDTDKPRGYPFLAAGKPLLAKRIELERVIGSKKTIDPSRPAHGISRWKFFRFAKVLMMSLKI
jgi:hypothetical protein